MDFASFVLGSPLTKEAPTGFWHSHWGTDFTWQGIHFRSDWLSSLLIKFKENPVLNCLIFPHKQLKWNIYAIWSKKQSPTIFVTGLSVLAAMRHPVCHNPVSFLWLLGDIFLNSHSKTLPLNELEKKQFCLNMHLWYIINKKNNFMHYKSPCQNREFCFKDSNFFCCYQEKIEGSEQDK